MKKLAAAVAIAAVTGAPSIAHERPLGDGKITSSPRVDYLMSCQQRFNANAPGAHRTGDWISGNTYDTDEKPTVDGSVNWPSRISVSLQGNERVVSSNNLPNHPTGNFPIARNDDAYQYDRNPNRISEQNILLRLPANPQLAANASCVPMGMIGFALSGVAIYNAVDASGRDAPAHEIQDKCGGHPQRSGQYHYHDLSPCLTDTRSGIAGHSNLVGYALDGFGIYGLHGENGEVMTNADLDECHGHTHTVMWDGAPREIYHYHMTNEYPYTLGCYRGTPQRVAGERIANAGERRGPPQAGERHAGREQFGDRPPRQTIFGLFRRQPRQGRP
ncbi:MAG: YHYH protein [Rhizobiaceae bacterium]|nr:YHYH protein [Rhizobiaceae bacterium]